MVFTNSLVWVLNLFIFLWLGGLSIFLFRTIANYNRLTHGASEKTLSEILNQMLQQGKLNNEELKKVIHDIENVRHEARKHIQKIALVRFNPFSDTGGDQSFTLALLDGNDDGIIVTSLYARTGVRWYIKTIQNAKGIEHELSKEEQEAIKKARKPN